MLHSRQTIVTLIALVLAAVLTVCSGSGETVEPPNVEAGRPGNPVDLDGTEWVLTSLNGSSLVKGSNITLNFAEGWVNGFAGCNSYSGEYTAADEGTLAIGEMAITVQLCQTPTSRRPMPPATSWS